MKTVAKLLADAAEHMQGSMHPRISIAWQTTDMVYTNIYTDNRDDGSLGKRLHDLYEYDDQVAALTAAKQRVIDTGLAHNGTYTLTLPGEATGCTYDMTIRPVRNSDGVIEGLMTISVDMSDIRGAYDRLSEANERLLELLDSVLDAPMSSHKPS